MKVSCKLLCFLVELKPSVLCPAVLQFSYVASNEKEIGLVRHRVLHSPVTSELTDSPLSGGAQLCCCLRISVLFYNEIMMFNCLINRFPMAWYSRGIDSTIVGCNMCHPF